MRHLLAAFLSAIVSMLSFAAAAQQPGTLVSAEPMRDTPGGMQAWRVRYWTTSQDGVRQEVTGVVVAPREAIPPRPRRVIAWAHGTSGVVEKCALSIHPDFFTATPGLEQAIRQGYVVVAPDYPGLGSPMPHPYLVGGDTARSVLDAVRAARAIPGAAAGSQFAVWGESQGGHAALWTATAAGSYAPDLTLVGTAAAAPPTDLAENMRKASEPNVRAMMMAFTLYSWSEHFGYSLDGVVNRTNQGVVRRLAQNNCITLGSTPKLGTILGIVSVRGALRNKDMGRIAPWAATMRANSVDATRVPGPLLIAQSVKDPLVAAAVTRKFAKAICRHRTALRWIELPGGDHAHSARDSATETLAWIGARFDGAPPPDDCRRL